ncbi:MAG TPA: hypothetical protein VL172_03920, partial [Kofleriaceae bacterium]|nr:hypothetical protein [Kofleriaceae bacterium]
PAAKPIAVLPLRNGGPAEDQYLADGLTEEIIDGLSMVRGLRVRSRSSVMAVAGDRDPRELGRELDVQVVVEGSLRRGPGGLRVSTRLISVADGFQLWARRFDRPESELLMVADEITRAIADALLVAAPPPDRDAPGGDALDLYLRGRHAYHRMRRGRVNEAIELFQRALALAPANPTILSGYALARARQFFISDQGSEDAVRLGRDAAEQAMALAPGMAEPHLALASILLHEACVPEAVRELRRALAIRSGLAEAHEQIARISVEVGLIEEGIRHLEAAIAIEPSMQARWELPRALALLGRVDQAREFAISWARSVPDAGTLFHFFAQLRLAMWTRDLPWLEKLALEGGQMDAELNYVGPLVRTLIEGGPMPQLPRLGPMADEGGWRQRSFFRQLRAELAAAAGAHADALVGVEQAVEAGLIDLAWLDRCPLLAPLRDQPRFQTARAIVAARVAPIIDVLMRDSAA